MKYGKLELGQIEAIVNQLGGMEGVNKFLRGQMVVTEVPQALLNLSGVTSPLVTTEPFIAKNKFVVNMKHDAPVKIDSLSDSFVEWFLSGDGKNEHPILRSVVLCYAKLREPSRNMPIIVEIGGEERSETTLTEMFCLVEMQKNGEGGFLHNNGWANIFYIPDQNGTLRSVGVNWYNGWHIFAHSVECERCWCPDYRVFYRGLY